MSPFDQSSYPVFWISVSRRCLLAACLQQPNGCGIDQIVYTQWLNEDAGIEADVTITRTAVDQFMVVAPCASEGRDGAWLRRHAQGLTARLNKITTSQSSELWGPSPTYFCTSV